MRVSERQMYDSGSGRLGRLRERFSEVASQASSGLRVPMAAKDPSATALMQRNDAQRLRAESFERNTAIAANTLEAVDGALGEASNVLENVLSTALQMANDTYSAGDRNVAATAVDAQLGALVQVLNVELDGRFLLGGTADGAPPFATDGSYSGNNEAHTLEVAPGVFEEISVRADLAVTPAGGGVDVLGTVIALRDALRVNDRDAIRASIASLSTAVEQLSDLRAESGAKGAMLLTAQAAANNVRLTSDKSTAIAGDVDIAATASELALAERAFEAASAATAKTFRLTLLDTLR